MSDYARLIEILERLVGHATVTGDKRAAFDCLQYVERLLSVAGLEITSYSSNGYESLVATTKRATKRPKVLLQAHLDVVPADESMFAMRREGNHLIGRGVFDMKYAAACFLLLVEELQESLADYDFGLMFTTDEEGDGLNGVKYLLDQGYGCDVCILPDGGDNWRLETAAKGGWGVRATARGKTAHGSRPWEGANAIDKLMAFLSEARQTVTHNDPTGTTLAISQIEGGKAHNQIPDEACATMDIRYLNHSEYEAVHAAITRLASEHQITLATITSIPPIQLDPSLEEIQQWTQIVSDKRGEKNDRYALSFGASDARFFAEKGIPCIVTRPDGGGHHSDSEWIDEAGLYDFYECVKKYVTHVSGPTP